MDKYVLLKEEYIKDIDSNAKLYKHVKSGARVVTLSNTDNNKTFTIGFRTPPVNNTGVPHILEHSTLSGSKKFPVKDPFVELLKGSLNTFLNAVTFSDKTLYPVASCNTKDFENLMEVYLDAVFYSNVDKHEEIFKQEGWHYELDDKDSEIKINGVVYNEMKGAFSNAMDVVGRRINHSLFPDTTYGCESGGDPKYIPDLSYEEFKDFRHKYYSPANSYIVLYGDMDMEERLEYMDREYLSKFKTVKVDSKIEYQKPFDEMRIERFEYPISKDEEATNKTYYAYNAVIGDYKDDLLSTAFSILSYVLLDIPGAELRQALLDSGICTDVFGGYDDGVLQPVFSVAAKDAKEGREEEFKNIVIETLKRIKKEGIDKKALLSAINISEFRYKEADVGRFPKGLLSTIYMFGSWLYDDDKPFEKLKISDLFDVLRKKVTEDYFENLIDKYLINNNHSSLIIASPSNTLLEKEEKELKTRLKAYKDSLTDTEIEKLIEDTKAQRKYSETPSSAKDLAKLPQLKRSDISPECLKHMNEEKMIDGVKSIEHHIKTNGIGYLKVQFDASKIKQEYIPYLSVLSMLLTQVDTKNYTYQELAKNINLNTGGLSSSAGVYVKGEPFLFFAFDTKYFFGKESYVFEYLNEVIMGSKFKNKTRIKEVLQEAKSGLSMSLMQGGDRTAFRRALSYISKEYYYQEQISGIALYQFLKDLLDDFDNNFKPFVSKLNKLVKQLFREENLIVSYTGLEFGYRDYLKQLKESLYTEDTKKYTHKFIKNIRNEAFKTPGKVQYVAKVGIYDKERITGVYQAMYQILLFEYLWVKVRVMGGAYGARTMASRSGAFMFASFRDPNLKNTLDVYDGVPDFIKTLKLKENKVLQFIIGAVGRIDAPLTPRAYGDYSFVCYLTDLTDEEEARLKSELLNTTLKDLKALSKVYKKILKQNVYCVVGNENTIEANKELFKEVKNLL